MKTVITCLLGMSVLASLGAALALAQTQPGPFGHIIIVVQENRTPDNLFGAGWGSGVCRQKYAFESGVDLADGGKVYVSGKGDLPLCTTPLALSGWDPAIHHGVDPSTS